MDKNICMGKLNSSIVFLGSLTGDSKRFDLELPEVLVLDFKRLDSKLLSFMRSLLNSLRSDESSILT